MSEVASQGELEPYLHRFAAALAALPLNKQAEMQREVRAHLESLVAASIAEGTPRDQAVASAMQQFGDAQDIGRQMAREWHHNAMQMRWAKWLVRPCAAPFALLFVWNLKPVLQGVFTPELSFEWWLAKPSVALFALATTFSDLLPWLLCGLMAWRIFQMRRWACIVVAVAMWYVAVIVIQHLLVLPTDAVVFFRKGEFYVDGAFWLMLSTAVLSKWKCLAKGF